MALEASDGAVSRYSSAAAAGTASRAAILTGHGFLLFTTRLSPIPQAETS
jgi:hypothetical protein